MTASQSPFDVIVLTAANAAQAAGYRAQLEERERQGLLPAGSTWRVIADPGGKRVGSGGSTLAVLAELAATLFTGGRTFAERFAGHRILIAHSGGDARRIPAYAASGKIFMPMPCDVVPPGRPPWERAPAALFDLLLQTLAKLPRPDEGQIVLCSGDVLLTFDAANTDLSTPGGITGLGFAAAPATGRHHGVYLTPSPSVGGPVTDFLQKPTHTQMMEHGAVDSSGRVLIDTGVFCLSPHAADALLAAAGVGLNARGVKINSGLQADVLAGRAGSVDLYQEIALALPQGMTRDSYLASVAPHHRTLAARRSLAKFFDSVRAANLPFNVTAVPDGEFFHVGTTRDLLTKFIEPSRTARLFGFRNGHRTAEAVHAEDRSRFLTVFNTIGEGSFQAQETSYVEACEMDARRARQKHRLAGENVLVGISTACPGWNTPLNLPRGVGMTCLPFRSRAAVGGGETVDVPLLFGVDDDNKATLESGQCQFLNRPLQSLLEAGITRECLWPEAGEYSVWTARLWVVGERSGEALRLLLRVLHGAASVNSAALALLEIWEQEARVSWAELVAGVDHDELLQRRRRLAARLDQEQILDDLLRYDDFPAATALARLAAAAADSQNSFLSRLESRLPNFDTLPWLTRARLLRLVAVVAEQVVDPSSAQKSRFFRSPGIQRLAAMPIQSADDFQRAALQAVASSLESTVELAVEPRAAAILEDQAVWVTAPARLDFAGGWSDTPPLCLERGGTVLNAAVTLNRQYPVQVVAKLNDEGCIRLTSIDLGQQEIYREASEINGPLDLGHWSSLARAALVLAGIAPDHKAASQSARGRHALRHWLDELGGGLDLTLFSGLPKGSGMGTSSILGAATLACLARVLGHELTHAELVAQTSLLEQRMTSGGGWQDQVG
ncbi:MAG TPA: L-fucokinase, partial [Abditibacteriaceae bacterium]|nr:L-fucokinase [Abditibacteriaceae bacterium]